MPPVISTAIIATVKFSLLPVKTGSFNNNFNRPRFNSTQFLVIKAIALISYLVFGVQTGSFCGRLSILFKLFIKCIATCFCNVISLDHLARMSFISLPIFVPCSLRFRCSTVFSMFLVFLISTARALNSASTLTTVKFGQRTGSERVSNSVTISKFISTISSLFKYLPVASFDRGIKLVTVARIIGEGTVTDNTIVVILTKLVPTLKIVLTSLPRTILNNYALVVFNSVIISNIRVVDHYKCSREGVDVTTLSLSVKLKFARAPRVFHVFPRLLQDMFTRGYMTIIFVITILLGLVFPGKRGRGTITKTTR